MSASAADPLHRAFEALARAPVALVPLADVPAVLGLDGAEARRQRERKALATGGNSFVLAALKARLGV
jgi:hypothetical protein